MAFSARITLTIEGRTTGAPDVGAALATVNETFDFPFGDGTGEDQAKQVYVDDFTITGGTAQTYDLAGSLTNALGGAVVFTAIKAMVIVNTSTTELTYSGGVGTFAGFLGNVADTILIPAGGFVAFGDPTAAGQAVTASSADIVSIDAAAAGAGTIIIIGETA
jgi:hypothetical protein